MMKIYNLINGVIGALMLALAFILPLFAREAVILATQKVTQSVITEDSGELIFSMFFYVLHQMAVCFILYLGAILLAVALTKRRSILPFQFIFTIIIMGSVYLLNVFYMDQFSYLTHILMIISVLLLYPFVLNHRIHIVPFSIVMIQIISSIQWLNLIPQLSFLGFGSDDVATSIKVADSYLTGNRLLSTLGVTFFILFFILTLLFTLLIFIYGKQIQTLKSYQEQERELKDARIEIIESRVFKEIHTLVHDLKTPLVSVEGLTSLLPMVLPENDRLVGYSVRIQESVQKMKEMISEILYEDIRKEIEVKELIDYTVSHTVITRPLITFSVKVEEDLPRLRVNKIRFARAITNIIENAIFAIGEAPGSIHLTASLNNKAVEMTVTDDGPGIAPEILKEIWQEGFSTKHSTGLGLPFVKTVINNHGGSISITSDKGTKVKITIPLDEKGNENDNSSYHR